jgi:hypothetical protein
MRKKKIQLPKGDIFVFERRNIQKGNSEID